MRRGKATTPTETILEKKLRKKNGFIIIAGADMLRVRRKVRFIVIVRGREVV